MATIALIGIGYLPPIVLRNFVVSRTATVADNYFFALTLPSRTTEQLLHWRATALPADTGIPVAREQLYMVLAWMNAPTASQLTQLQPIISGLRSPSFTLTLNDAGYWPRSGQLWIGCRPAPRELLQLADLLRSRVARIGCPQPAFPFHPHVTLLRQAPTSIRLPKRDFSWPVTCQHFSLISSRYQRGRVILNTEQHYPLFDREQD
ncbi:RNA 2',3'-cyclic phosphodiesterase [Rosenbergiella nectarea]|uniref:RNA 2',3'-cyclic phosphodiesterase n=1 Tax=Rosenbergiella nectarea TaxID=988801 RepID=UPI001F4D9119|nr:RNA 2',3'-cyclic phosphodiesterase [Rosenbergiella nectarea]